MKQFKNGPRGFSSGASGKEPASQCKTGPRLPSGKESACWCTEEAVPGPSVLPSGEPGVSGDFWGSQEGCQGPFRSLPSPGALPQRPPCLTSPRSEGLEALHVPPRWVCQI